jgi:hypothetical protein
VPKFIDFIYTLRLRGRGDEADYYFYAVPQIVQMKEHVPPEELMLKEINEALWLFNKPIDPEGWTETCWGKRAVGDRDN